MSKDLKTKHRPPTFKKFVGNEEVVMTLKKLIKMDRIPNAMLFIGDRGCGKTTLGRIVAKEIGCNMEHDFTELDSAVFNGIATVRELRSTAIYPPRAGKKKVYLIDEAHMLGQGGDSEKNKPQNAILKSLEEPPEYLHWILCTTDPQRLLKTVRDRCDQFKVGPLDDETAYKYIKKIGSKEKVKLPKSVIQTIVEMGEGRPRTMLSMLGKVVHLDKPKDMKAVLAGEDLSIDDGPAEAYDLAKALMKGGKKGGRWGDVSSLLKDLKKVNPESVRKVVIAYATTALLGDSDRAGLILGWFLERPFLPENDGYNTLCLFSRRVVNNEQPPL